MTPEEYLRFLQEQSRTGYAPQGREPVPDETFQNIRELRLPDGRKVTADDGLSDDEAMEMAKKRFPESFNVRRYSPSVDDDSSPFEAFGSSFTRTRKGLIPGARAFGSVLSGDQEGYEAAQKDIAEASEAAMEIAPSLVTTDDILKTYEEDGLLSAAAKSMEFGTEQIFSSVGRMAPAMAAGGAGALAGSMIAPGVGTLVGGVLGFSGVNLASYLSEDLERAYEEGAANIEDVEAGKTFAAAAGQTALDNLGFLVAGAAAAPAKAIAGVGAKAAGESVVRNSARGAAGKFLSRINNTTKTKAFLGTLVEEEVAEIGQQALERWQAGLEVSPADEEAAQEYLEIAFATLFPSAGFAGLTVGGMKAKEKYGLRIETGKKKVGDKLFDISKGLIKLSEQDKARLIEEQAEDAVQGVREETFVTVEDIHNVANDRNILWDDDAGFMSFSNRKTGSYDLDSIQEDQTELRKIYDRISAMPRQDVPSSLQLASEEEAVLLASKLSKKKSKKFTIAGVKAALKLKDANISEAVADQIAQGHIDKMADMGMVSIDDKGKMSILPKDKSVNQQVYDQVIDASREKGSFVSFRQFVSEHGFTDKKSMEQYEAIKARALVRGDIVQSGNNLTPVVLDPSYTEDGFRIMVNGELQPSWYGSREDAEADANNLYSQEGQITFDQAESDRLAADGLSDMELDLREAGVRSSTDPEQRVIKEVLRDRPESNIEIVESPKSISVEAAKGFDYRISGKKRKMFVARDSGGSVLKIFSSRSKADTYVESRKKNSFSFDVTVGESVIGRFKSRADAQQRLKGHKAEIQSRFTEDARRTLQEQGIFAPNLIEREASKRGASEAKNYFRRENTKIERIGVDPGIEVNKEEGFVLSERKVVEGGKEYAPKTVGFYETEAMANQAKQSAELGRVGAESLQGKIDKNMSPAEAAEISFRRENPEIAAKESLPPAPPEQGELIQKATTTLNNELRKVRGLDDFTVNLSRSMAEEGQSLATFNDATRVITIAFTPDLENMSEADVVRTLAPLMNHETIHAFRKLGAIKAKEWSNLTRFVANKKLPESRIQELNTELVNLGKQPVPEGATYLDYATNLYSDSGNKIDEVQNLKDLFESGAINEDVYKENILAVDQTKWIKDDYVEEAVAFAYQDWSENPTSISGQPRNLMQRMTNVVEKMGRALRGQGYNSAEEIFETLYGDQMAARIQAGKSLDLWWSRRPGEMAGVLNDIDVARVQSAKIKESRRSSAEERVRKEASEKDQEISDDEVNKRVDKILSDEGYGSINLDEADSFDEAARFASEIDVNEEDSGESREREAKKVPAPSLPVPESMDSVSSLEDTSRLATGQTWKTNRDLKKAMQDRVKAASEEAEVDLSIDSEERHEYLTRVGTKDAFTALEQNPNSVGWYDEKTRQALSVMSLVHPEIATDLNSKFTFIYILATTSNGQKVEPNFSNAEKIYSRYKETGVMPTDMGTGTSRIAINNSLGLFNKLSEAWGMDNLRKFMLTEMTVGDIGLVAPGLKPDKENVSTSVRGAAIIGPKVGNGFFSNLFGNFDALTMDRWLVRTWGRWTGTLLEIKPEQTERSIENFQVARDNMSSVERSLLEELLVAPISEMSNEDLAVAVSDLASKEGPRDRLMKTTAGNELRLRANNLAGYLDGQKESPDSGTERNEIRRAFKSILEEVRKDPRYQDLTVADLQAAIWYAEKRLYETAKEKSSDTKIGGYDDSVAPDYANAAVSVARSKGKSDSLIEQALEAERGRTGRTRLEDQQDGIAQEQSEDGRGFTPSERKQFFGGLATHNARSNRGSGKQNWGYSRRDRGRGRSDGLLEWVAGKSLKRSYNSTGVTTPVFLELKKDAQSAARFTQAIEESKKGNKFGAAVYVYPAAEYQNMRMFISETGKSGVAVKPNGDIVSGFSTEGAGRSMVELAIAAGGKKADAFDTVLPSLYSAHGLKVVSRLPWDDSQAPDGWNKETFARYKNGEPDVVFMALDPDYANLYRGNEGVKSKSYDAAVRTQTKSVGSLARAAAKSLKEEAARAGSSREREARSLGDIRKTTSGQMYRSPIPDTAYELIRPPGAKPGDNSPNNISWGIGRFDGMGKYLKAGTRVVVLDGYHEDAVTMPGGKKIKAKGFGRKHIEKHDQDIRDYTPYADWRELLTAFFRELKNQPRRITGGPIIPYSEPGSFSYLWSDPESVAPILITGFTFDTSKGPTATITTAYPTEQYDAPVNSHREKFGYLHGEEVSMQAMKDFLNPDQAMRFTAAQRARQAIRTGRRRTPERSKALEENNLGFNPKAKPKTIWDAVSGAITPPNAETIDRFAKGMWDRFARIRRVGDMAKEKASDLGLEWFDDLFDVSAHAMALTSERAQALLAVSMRDGIVTYKHGVPMVEDLELITEIAEMVPDPETGEMVQKTFSLPDMYETEGNKGGLLPILAPALETPGGSLLPELFLFMRAKRGMRLSKEDNKVIPMSEEAIMEGYKVLEDHPELAIVAANLQRWNQGIIDFQKDTGMLDEAGAEIYGKYSDYIPFYLNLEGETTDSIEQIMINEARREKEFLPTQGLANQTPHKKYKGIGQDSALMEPIEAITKNAGAAIQAGLRNVASQRSIRDALLIGLAKEMKQSEVDRADIKTKATVLKIRHRGQDRLFSVTDPLLHETLVGSFDGNSPSRFVSFLSKPADVLRGMVQRSPEYLIANMLRDSMHVYTVNGGKHKPVYDSAKQYAANINGWRKGEAVHSYKMLQRLGAAGGVEMTELTPRKMKRYFARKSGKDNKALGLLTKAWDFTGELSAQSESSTRQLVYESAYNQAYKTYKDRGFSDEVAKRKAYGEAGFQAMEILNFARRGDSNVMRFITATVPFLNSRMQGIRATVNSLRGVNATGRLDPEVTAKATAIRMLNIMGISSAYAVYAALDEDRDNIRREIQDDNWLLPIMFQDKMWLSIPIPFEAGVLAKTIPEAIVRRIVNETTNGKRGDDWQDFKKTAWHAFSNTLSFNPMPQALKPLAQWYFNYDMFTQSPIVGKWEEDLPGELQRSMGTTAPAIGVAEMTGLSAKKVDNFFRTTFGGVSIYALQMVDNMMRYAMPGMSTRPMPRLTDVPIFRRFLKDEYGGGLKTEFYELRNAVNSISTAVREVSVSNPGEALKMQLENRELLAVSGTVRMIEKRLSEIRNMRTEAFFNNRLTRQMDDMLSNQENQILKMVPNLKRMSQSWKN